MTLAFGLLAGLAFTSSRVQAQTPDKPYTYTYATAPYTYLDANAATTILASDGWDDTTVVFNLPSGFDFKYHGVPVTQWRMDTYGGLYPNDLDFTLEAPAIMGIQSDYADNGNSKISFAVSGNAGSRIAKIEYRNLGFYDGLATDTANFQIWLYEGIHKIEYHAGPSHTEPGFLDILGGGGNFVMTGLLFDIKESDKMLAQLVNYKNGANTDTALVLDPTDPTLDEVALMLYNTQAYPVNGAVFIFNPKPVTSVKEVVARISTVSPNPATDKVTLRLKNIPPADARVTVYTVTGQQVISSKVTATNTEIALDGLSKGVYLLSYDADGKRETLRLIKK